jgi:hypothetical protein
MKYEGYSESNSRLFYASNVGGEGAARACEVT